MSHHESNAVAAPVGAVLEVSGLTVGFSGKTALLMMSGIVSNPRFSRPPSCGSCGVSSVLIGGPPRPP